jgi:hypothetical protein
VIGDSIVRVDGNFATVEHSPNMRDSVTLV